MYDILNEDDDDDDERHPRRLTRQASTASSLGGLAVTFNALGRAGIPPSPLATYSEAQETAEMEKLESTGKPYTSHTNLLDFANSRAAARR